MANEEHLSILKRGLTAWNEWRAWHRETIPDFVEADLSGTDLAGADMVRADLKGADLSGADVRNANLIGADLRTANLSRANLGSAGFISAKLNGADLRGAILIAANLRDADLRGADLSDSTMWLTSMANVDFSGAKGLETVKHAGPSSIGIDTIYRSKGEISEVFLQRAGVPDSFVAQMKSLVGAAVGIKFQSCFISHSKEDKEFANRLYGDLGSKSVRCFIAPDDMHGGEKGHEQIYRAIDENDRLLLILSLDSMKSEWVKTEIAHARKREIQEKKKVLFPIRLVSLEAIRVWQCFDADTGKDSAKEIREYHIPDFSNWEDPAQYKLNFDQLLHDLKA